MEKVFEVWKDSRKMLLKLVNNYSLEQLNKIPEGHNNNLIWNFGHVIVAQQGLVYGLSGIESYISKDLVSLYKRGSFPTGNTDQTEVDELKELSISLIDKTIEDFKNKKFKAFTEYQTITGAYLDSFEKSLEFNNFHEGIHLGMMLGLRKHL